LSRSEAKLIRPGLKHIVSAHSQPEQRGKDSYSPQSSTSPHCRKDEGEYNPVVLAIIARALDKTGVASETRRVHLDVFELAACILGVRASQTLVRHRHMEPWLRNHSCAAQRLLSKLERIRKRGKRAFIRLHGSATFTASSQRWQQGLRFVRSFFLSCTCRHPPFGETSRRGRRKRILASWLEKFRSELPAAGIEVPPKAELRDLVKRALRSGRRFIDYYGLQTARDHHDLLHERIWNFVADRCRRQREKYESISVMSSVGSSSPIETPNKRRKHTNMVKTKVQSEISTKEHPAGNFKSAEPEQPLHGQLQTQALPDAPSKLDQERQDANGCNGRPPIDALPTQPTDSELARLCVDWPNLSSTLERSERLQVVIAKGHSRRAVARAIGRSEGNIRQHLKFRYLTDEERQALEAGSVSGKKVLRKVQERVVSERLERLKLSKQEWTREVERLAKVAVDWLRGLDLNQPYLERLFGELGGGRGNIRLAEFARYAPKPWEIPTDKAPEAVIKACQPKGDTQTMSGPDYVNYCFAWYARWSQRVMPDRKLRDRVLCLVEGRLLYAPPQ